MNHFEVHEKKIVQMLLFSLMAFPVTGNKVFLPWSCYPLSTEFRASLASGRENKAFGGLAYLVLWSLTSPRGLLPSFPLQYYLVSQTRGFGSIFNSSHPFIP